MAFGRWTSSTPHLWRGSRGIHFFTVFSFALLLALTGVMGAQDSAEASGSLSFANQPTSASVTSGSAAHNVVKVRASGTDKRNIRYAISGNSAFKITPRGGRVRYDGSAISGSSVNLVVTASDRKGNYTSATHNLTVTVASAAQSSATPSSAAQTCKAGLILEVGDRCVLSEGSSSFIPGSVTLIEILSDGRARVQYTCWLIARCQRVVDTSFTFGDDCDLSIEMRQGKWIVTRVG